MQYICTLTQGENMYRRAAGCSIPFNVFIYILINYFLNYIYYRDIRKKIHRQLTFFYLKTYDYKKKNNEIHERLF